MKHTLDLRVMHHSQTYQPIDSAEIYEWIKTVRDPEHLSMTLEDLKVVSKENIVINDANSSIQVTFVPTTTNCTMGSIIGLAIKVLLMRILPLRFRIEVLC